MKAAAPIAIAAGSLALLARRSLNNWACLAALLLLAFSVNCRVQIGVRMQLPLIALAAVGLSAAITHAVGPTVGWRRGAASAAVALGMSWLAASTGANWPDGLCYINEFWGGSEDGEQLLSDSNYDWGQGLPALDAWRREHGESEVAIWYFGTDPAASRPPFHNVPLQLLNVPNERALAKEIRTRYLAVGASILYGSYVKEPDWLLIKLRCTKPVARTRTFLIYDVQGLTADAAP
jgi:hypothetical protein